MADATEYHENPSFALVGNPGADCHNQCSGPLGSAGGGASLNSVLVARSISTASAAARAKPAAAASPNARSSPGGLIVRSHRLPHTASVAALCGADCADRGLENSRDARHRQTLAKHLFRKTPPKRRAHSPNGKAADLLGPPPQMKNGSSSIWSRRSHARRGGSPAAQFRAGNGDADVFPSSPIPAWVDTLGQWLKAQRQTMSGLTKPEA